MSEPMLIELVQLDDVCVVHLKGRFVTGVDLNQLYARMSELRSRNCRKMIVDLSEVSFIGSTGIGFLVGIYTSIARIPGGRFVLAGLSPRVHEVFDITRLSTLIPIAADLEAALASVRAEGLLVRSAQTR